MIESPSEVSEAELRALLAQLSLDEKVRLMTRVDLPTPWEVPRIGLQPLRLSDGPAGVRPQSPDDYPLLTPCETVGTPASRATVKIFSSRLAPSANVSSWSFELKVVRASRMMSCGYCAAGPVPRE